MTDLTWYRTRLQHLDDRLWLLKRVTYDVGGLEDRLRGLWNDSAAHEVQGRFVQPLHEEHSAAHHALIQGAHHLHQLHVRLEELHEHCRQLAQLSDFMTEILGEAQREIQRSHQERERSLTLTGHVLQSALEIERLVSSADNTV
ncbi:hypothetical protein [Deinococcus hopiensis]|uniref:Uncharacterized protein n=1 Tax=Deinococcus hopiensis KR-140 TaxID=695939 RepID=A0A1W1ULS5_9DEIO|nr:hypothetical protein [Deinococcus hopiensis]SMB82010.1 hypothetical protein SAMN00790413_04811 [Deinococcus hopiensis KR-140]